MGMEAQAEFSPHLKIRNLQVGGAEGLLAARLYAVGEAAGKRDTLIVFFHSGGFVGGDLDEGDTFLRHPGQPECQHRGAGQYLHAGRREAFPCCGGRCPRRAAVGEEEQSQIRLEWQAFDRGRHRRAPIWQQCAR
jgi:hypothetical protein